MLTSARGSWTNLFNIEDLKNWLHQQLPRSDKLLLIVASFDSPCQIKDIVERARDAGLRFKAGTNLSIVLKRTNGLAIRSSQGWELTETGKAHLRSLGVGAASPAAAQIAVDLRKELVKVIDADTRAFVEEAIRCYEYKLYRSAVVMSWLSAVDLLHKFIHANHLAAFNADATRTQPKWKPATTPDDIGLMKEADFLDTLVRLSVLGKNVKTELKSCLDRRNGCGHPNSLKLGQNTVAHHIEVLLLNVFQRFT